MIMKTQTTGKYRPSDVTKEERRKHNDSEGEAVTIFGTNK